MTTPTIKTINFTPVAEFDTFLSGLVSKSFEFFAEIIKSVVITIEKTTDPRVPFRTQITTVLESGSAILSSESVSSNHLAAFSQALSRMERQLGKLV